MPQIKSAKKRVAITARQTAENNLHRARARTTLKKIRALAASGKPDEARKLVPTAQKYVDKAAKVRAIHPRTADRQKARLANYLKQAKTKPATAKAATKKTAPKKPAAKKPPADTTKTKKDAE